MPRGDPHRAITVRSDDEVDSRTTINHSVSYIIRRFRATDHYNILDTFELFRATTEVFCVKKWFVKCLRPVVGRHVWCGC